MPSLEKKNYCSKAEIFLIRFSGFKLSFQSVATVAMRYGGKERTLFFEDYVLCIAKTLQMYGEYMTFITQLVFIETCE